VKLAPPEARTEQYQFQSALAIQNARLFREIEIKSRQLEAASQILPEVAAQPPQDSRADRVRDAADRPDPGAVGHQRVREHDRSDQDHDPVVGVGEQIQILHRGAYAADRDRRARPAPRGTGPRGSGRRGTRRGAARGRTTILALQSDTLFAGHRHLLRGHVSKQAGQILCVNRAQCCSLHCQLAPHVGQT